MSTKGLIKLTGAANKIQAREDYQRLQLIAIRHGLQSYTPALPDRAGWRKIDQLAKHAVERIVTSQPELREEVRTIYPGLF
jgi:hypothetical protein